MQGKPVITIINTSNPFVISEFEKEADAILLHFAVQDQALMDILTGKVEPNGLLPMQMPKDMKTVELQAEDLPFDMEVHADSEGNRYEFGYGMNWKGVIKDARTNRYSRKK